MSDIITDLDVLSERSDEIDVAKQGKLVQETNIKLKKILNNNKDLNALSAPMIGVPYRMFVVKFNDKLKCFVNPMIQRADGLELSREKCECLPGKEFIRPRNNKIQVIYSTPLGKIESTMLAGKAAIVFQHQIDHLDGLLLSDVGLEIDEEFDKASDSSKMELIDLYLDSLDIKRKNLEKEIAEDEELSKLVKAIDFIENVQNGNVKVEHFKK